MCQKYILAANVHWVLTHIQLFKYSGATKHFLGTLGEFSYTKVHYYCIGNCYGTSILDIITVKPRFTVPRFTVPPVYRASFCSPKYRFYMQTNVNHPPIYRAPRYTVHFLFPPPCTVNRGLTVLLKGLGFGERFWRKFKEPIIFPNPFPFQDFFLFYTCI